MTTSFIDWLKSHPAALTIAFGWIVREAHLWWPKLVSIYPYAIANGGIVGIAKKFFIGQAKTTQPPKP